MLLRDDMFLFVTTSWCIRFIQSSTQGLRLYLMVFGLGLSKTCLVLASVSASHFGLTVLWPFDAEGLLLSTMETTCPCRRQALINDGWKEHWNISLRKNCLEQLSHLTLWCNHCVQFTCNGKSANLRCISLDWVQFKPDSCIAGPGNDDILIIL